MSNKAFRLYARLFESAIIVNRITYLQDIDNFSDGIMSLIDLTLLEDSKISVIIISTPGLAPMIFVDAKDGVYYLSSNSPDEDQNRHIQFGALHPWHPHHPKRSSMLL
jgi:hypothetical protein